MNQQVHFSEDLSKYELLALTKSFQMRLTEIGRWPVNVKHSRMQKANLVDWETGLYLTTKMLKTAGFVK